MKLIRIGLMSAGLACTTVTPISAFPLKVPSDGHLACRNQDDLRLLGMAIAEGETAGKAKLLQLMMEERCFPLKVGEIVDASSSFGNIFVEILRKDGNRYWALPSIILEQPK